VTTVYEPCYCSAMGYTGETKRKYQRDWMAKRRRTWLRENGPCSKCGSKRGLQVDHIDPLLKVSHNVWSWSSERRVEELAKCQVLCSSCHKKKTTLQRREQHPIPHGTDSGYTRRKCRCPDCREAHRVAKHAWRESQRAKGLSAS